MADDQEKTEEPTDKKIEDAKKEGNVGKSAEVVGAATLTFGSLYLLYFSSFFLSSIGESMKHIYAYIASPIDNSILLNITFTIISSVMYALLPFYIMIILLVFIFNWMQFGMLLNPLKLDLQKLDPIKGMGNVISIKKLVELLKLTAKLAIIFLVMVVLFLITGEAFLAMMDKDILESVSTMIILATYFLFTILFIIIIFAIIDFYFVKYNYMKSLRMSKQEIKDEFKNMEGDPQVKGRIRQIQMQMAKKRMMKDVADADVVITNPTHYAIALKYDNTKNSAPKMVAKGVDFIAMKIKDIANENKIPIIENPPLARALYEQLEIEQQIPEEFYKAVAEIFTYIYRLKGKG